jgi:glutaminyl-peptide cyclotransferase
MRRRSILRTRSSVLVFQLASTTRSVFSSNVLLFLIILNGSVSIANEPAQFSGTRAMEYLEAICELGPRPSGSKGMEKQRELLIRHFQKAGATVFRQAFQSRDGRNGDWVRMENLIVSWHPERNDRVLLGAHYDTRPYPDRDRRDPRGIFLGANDGASGVAVLMELADSVAELKGSVGVDFVLFDAEEYVFEERRDSYCLGSLFFARQYASSRKAGTISYAYRCGVILDMVGDRNLTIWQEQQSVDWHDTRPVVESIWATAKELQIQEFVPRPKYLINDDHVPLRMTGGIPTCDIIDFDYPHWHTTQDIPENCSAHSLGLVGRVILSWLQNNY